MSFLAPLFLLGGLALAVPVVFHLIRRTTRERTPFSSLMFLFPTPPRLTKRSRLEHLLLLALRCLAILLLALGFARPFLKQAVSAPPPGTARRVLLLVDTSASMRRATLWPDALGKVRDFLRHTTPLDQVSVFTFDRQLVPLVSFDQWNASPAGDRAALVQRKLADLSPGWSSTRLDSALIQAAETLADAEGKAASSAGEILLISDLQEGSHLEQLQGYEWPKRISVTVEALKSKHAGNASLQLMADSDSASPAPERLRVRVSNTSDATREQFQIGWVRNGTRGFSGPAADAYVPPGQSRVITVPAPPAVVSGSRLVLQGDEEDFDDAAFSVPLEPVRLKVLYLGNEQAGDPRKPLYFLRRAFQETGRQAIEVRAQPPGAAVTLSDLQDASLVVVADALPDGLADALHADAERGKTLVCVLKNPDAGPTLARLAGIGVVEATEVRPNTYAMLADIDFRDPLFAPFADPKFSDFTKIHFWRYRRLDPTRFSGARAVAKFDSGDPALMNVPVGRGQLLVLTSGWQPEDSQLALSTKFVPLLYSMLEAAGVRLSPPRLYHVGDVIPLSQGLRSPAGGGEVVTPEGARVRIDSGQTNFAAALTPGTYTFISGQTSNRFAVNLDPAESRTAPLSIEEFERLGVPLASQTSQVAAISAAKSRLLDTELESRQKLWRWLLVGALAILLLETWLAGRTMRRAIPATL